MNGEEALREIAMMFRHVGDVLQVSEGNAEEDFRRWLQHCREHGVHGNHHQLRNWYRSVLDAAGISQELDHEPLGASPRFHATTGR